MCHINVFSLTVNKISICTIIKYYRLLTQQDTGTSIFPYQIIDLHEEYVVQLSFFKNYNYKGLESLLQPAYSILFIVKKALQNTRKQIPIYLPKLKLERLIQIHCKIIVKI